MHLSSSLTSISLMVGATFKSIFRSSTRPDLQQYLCTCQKVQWTSSRIYKNLQVLKAGTSGSCVQPVHMHSGILSSRRVTTSSLYVFLKKQRWIFLKHHLKLYGLNGKSRPSPFIPEAGMTCSKSYLINGIKYITSVATRTDWGTQ